MPENLPRAMLAVAMVSAGILAGVAATRCTQPIKGAQAVEWLASPREINAFQLVTQQGNFERDDLLGGWHLILFGYTHCPDVCPTTLGELQVLKGRLEDAAPAVLFVSIDPARDTVQHLADYVSYFDPDFTAASGDPSQLDSITRSLGIRFEITGSPDKPRIAHSLTLSLIGPQGRLRGRLRPGFNVDIAAAEIAAAIKAGI